MDKLFQQEAMHELQESYNFNATEFDRTSSQFLDNLLDVALLRFYAEAVVEEQVDELQITFHSFIAGLGKKEIQFLVDMYQKMFKGLDFSFKLDKNTNTFTLEGYNLHALLRGESGIHLFHIPHQNPLPIQVLVKDVNVEKTTQERIQVVRLYNGTSTMTDLRTNYTNEGDISSNEFKLLLFGSLNSAQRQRVLQETTINN